jgi:hypothetical protein
MFSLSVPTSECYEWNRAFGLNMFKFPVPRGKASAVHMVTIVFTLLYLPLFMCRNVENMKLCVWFRADVKLQIFLSIIRNSRPNFMKVTY